MCVIEYARSCLFASAIPTPSALTSAVTSVLSPSDPHLAHGLRVSISPEEGVRLCAV